MESRSTPKAMPSPHRFESRPGHPAYSGSGTLAYAPSRTPVERPESLNDHVHPPTPISKPNHYEARHAPPAGASHQNYGDALHRHRDGIPECFYGIRLHTKAGAR